MSERIEQIASEALDSFCRSDRFVELVAEASFDVALRAPDHALPKSRGIFILALAADAHKRWGYTADEARKIAPSLMRDLEEACAPWGDPDYDWTVGAAREWAAEQLASDEDQPPA